MEIKKKYLSKYLHETAIEQIAEEYVQKGYNVAKEENLGKFRADLIARKGDEQIVIEVKSEKMSPDRKKELSGLADYVRNLGNYKFLIVIATPPKEKKLGIDNLEQLISNYIHDNLPDSLDELSSHTRPDEVTDVDVDEINISGNLIFVKGNGVVNVELQYEPDGALNKNDGFKNYDSFPFEYEISLKYNEQKELEITEVNKLKIDTSTYYEN